MLKDWHWPCPSYFILCIVTCGWALLVVTWFSLSFTLPGSRSPRGKKLALREKRIRGDARSTEKYNMKLTIKSNWLLLLSQANCIYQNKQKKFNLHVRIDNLIILLSLLPVPTTFYRIVELISCNQALLPVFFGCWNVSVVVVVK